MKTKKKLSMLPALKKEISELRKELAACRDELSEYKEWHESLSKMYDDACIENYKVKEDIRKIIGMPVGWYNGSTGRIEPMSTFNTRNQPNKIPQ